MMSKNQQEAIFRAFLDEKMQELGHSLDEESFQLLWEHTLLAERPGLEGLETRSAEITLGTDGKVSASMFSLYNVSQISVYDLFGFTLQQAGILAMGDKAKIVIALAFLAVVREFIKALDRPLNESEAKVLLAVHDLGKDSFAFDEVRKAYKTRFKTAISAEDLQRYLDAFVRMTLIRIEDKEKQLYSKRQRISLSH